MADSLGRLVPLVPGMADGREVTVYVKGFLGSGETPERFETWLTGHRALEASHGWGPHALGWTWSSGSLRSVPIPVASGAKFAVDVYRTVRRGRAGALGVTLGLLAAEIAGRFLVQYIAAARSAVIEAEHLAAELEALSARHERVRVVAHSLGCRQVLEATAHLAPAKRPHEIHLCAPAFAESDVAGRLAGLARERTYLYYAPSDLVLSLGYPLVARSRALGVTGPSVAYPGLTAIDVSKHFGFFVHNDYKHRFSSFVPGARIATEVDDSRPVEAPVSDLTLVEAY